MRSKGAKAAYGSDKAARKATLSTAKAVERAHRKRAGVSDLTVSDSVASYKSGVAKKYGRKKRAGLTQGHTQGMGQAEIDGLRRGWGCKNFVTNVLTIGMAPKSQASIRLAITNKVEGRNVEAPLNQKEGKARQLSSRTFPISPAGRVSTWETGPGRPLFRISSATGFQNVGGGRRKSYCLRRISMKGVSSERKG